MYKECQVILFAIKTKVENSNRYEILLNPRHYYVIKEGDLCVYMAESPKEVRDIKKMASEKQGYDRKLIASGFIEFCLCLANDPCNAELSHDTTAITCALIPK